MKRLYVISDSHGYRDFDMLLAASRDADAYAHLGDHASDGEEFARKNGKFTALVRGNCDPGSVQPDEEVITLDGVKILLVHGHTLGVKYSLTRLTYRALELGAACACYGHTHIADITWQQGVLLVCPGAFSSFSPQYARLDIKNGSVEPYLFCL